MKTILFIFSLLIISSRSSSQSIRAAIIDAETKKPLSARIVITDDTGHVYNSYYNRLKGFFTEEDGTFFQELKNGHYTIEIFHGIDYVSDKFSFSIENNKLDTTIALNAWYPLKKEGWYNRDHWDNVFFSDKKFRLLRRWWCPSYKRWTVSRKNKNDRQSRSKN